MPVRSSYAQGTPNWVAEPFDMPVGRIAVIQDPQGAVFSIIKPADQS
jgi:predicted enzyme related to lactoylglutathione lyase